jgi:hypothetical protein
VRADRSGLVVVALAVVATLLLLPSAARAAVFSVVTLERRDAVVVAWCDASPSGGEVHVGVWNRARRSWSSDERLRALPFCMSTLRLARSRESVFLLRSSESPDEASELVRLEPAGPGPLTTLVETGALHLAEGFAGSLDADDDHVALATFEQTTPVLPVTGDVAPPRHTMHLRVVDPRTMMILAARVLRGEALLRPHQVPDMAGHALVLAGGSLHVAVPDREAHLVTFGVPSLERRVDRILVVPPTVRDPRWSSVVLGRIGGEVVSRFAPPPPSKAAAAAMAAIVPITGP